eukprot:3057315-Alexandrium_andersonii.AAC.1
MASWPGGGPRWHAGAWYACQRGHCGCGGACHASAWTGHAGGAPPVGGQSSDATTCQPPAAAD